MRKLIYAILIFLLLAVSGCNSGQPTPPTPTETQVEDMPENLPEITSITNDLETIPKYESVEITVDLEADYTNPYDAREITLDGIFTAPDGTEMTVPGFWDGEADWLVRFTPWAEGTWAYQLKATDLHGTSQPATGSFEVSPSDLHGWIQVGSWVNPEYSSRYLVHHDGTPFYGIGHCDPLNILADGFDIERGVNLFDNMLAASENYVVWWPFYTNSPVNASYKEYSFSNMTLIDLVVRDAQKKGIFLIFTIWDHPQLRGMDHPWGAGNWNSNNGFRKLGDIKSFFTSDEAWIWQENLYRYIIARWGYSPAIGMWQTVSEINGTNAGDQTNPWHAKVNAYFVEHDPYRHPTTASMSGDVAWPEGHQEMDAPQVHVYDLEKAPIAAAETIASWTQSMWDIADKPNWIGEYGVTGRTYYPEMFHNANWAALSAGAAMTPAEWNDRNSWMSMSPEMNADMVRLAQFAADLPLAEWDPHRLVVTVSDPQVRGWGIAGYQGGLFWVQDFSMEGQTMEAIRQAEINHDSIQVEITGLAPGTYAVTPFDTWNGEFLTSFEISCPEIICTLTLPEFSTDMAFKLEHK